MEADYHEAMEGASNGPRWDASEGSGVPGLPTLPHVALDNGTEEVFLGADLLIGKTTSSRSTLGGLVRLRGGVVLAAATWLPTGDFGVGPGEE
jgi:hypothetical protein